MRSSNIRYLPAVDHLRAYAALLIVFYHGLHVFAYRLHFGADFGIDHWLQPANPLLAALAIWLELRFSPPFWVHVLLWVPLAAALTVGLLRLGKGLLLALEYRREAREGRLHEGD